VLAKRAIEELTSADPNHTHTPLQQATRMANLYSDSDNPLLSQSSTSDSNSHHSLSASHNNNSNNTSNGDNRLSKNANRQPFTSYPSSASAPITHTNSADISNSNKLTKLLTAYNMSQHNSSDKIATYDASNNNSNHSHTSLLSPFAYLDTSKGSAKVKNDPSEEPFVDLENPPLSNNNDYISVHSEGIFFLFYNCYCTFCWYSITNVC
jgi:hypothetical protein